MKLIVLLSGLISFSIFGAVCNKDLCVNDTVRDQYGYKGTVDSFNIEKGTVDVALEHIPSIWTFPQEDLGKKIECLNKICQRDIVTELGNSGSLINVVEVYSHGMIYGYESNLGGFFLYNIDELIKSQNK